MRNVSKLLSVLAFLCGAAVLHADTAPAAPPPVTLSDAEMTTRALGLQSQIQEDNRRVLFLREQAKKSKDVIKLSCVNDKLVQIKAQMNIADATNDQLQGALTKGGDDRQALYSQYASTAEAIKHLREEAAVCVGEPELFKQEGGGSFTHPDIPDDPTHSPVFSGELEPPAYASPYR
jgi:hypothetical protein